MRKSCISMVVNSVFNRQLIEPVPLPNLEQYNYTQSCSLTTAGTNQIKLATTTILAAVASLATLIDASPIDKRVSGVRGQDVSAYQPNVNFNTEASKGCKFVYIKATERTTFKSCTFSSQYNGATSAGLIRGAYHFARPNSSSGSAQAKFFLANGGGWSNDGRTLPGVVDLESVSGQPTCYGLSKSQLISWLQDFGSTYYSATGRWPTIYTSSGWWNECVASSAFAADYLLWIANYVLSCPKMPTGFSYYSFWQYADSVDLSGDQDVWNGSLESLKAYARG
ncbi:hypothetical protein NDA11_001542 [Ustilago hordei]|nr:hypothetical protein NDA15_007082 [Ustilago hordei]KAJ1582811.1 hypothetical protein NDA12_003483 [Ustilago hordei]KAJ1588550.1 hypothetical protein NDA11_001542 [Ustilago hordei]